MSQKHTRKLKKLISELYHSQNDINSIPDNIEKILSDLKVKEQTFHDDKEQLYNQLDLVKSELQALKTEKQAVKSDLSYLKSQRDDCRTKKTRLDQEIEKLSEQRKDVKAEMSSLNSQIYLVRMSLDSLISKTKDKNEEKRSLYLTLASVKGRIQGIRQQISELKLLKKQISDVGLEEVLSVKKTLPEEIFNQTFIESNSPRADR